MNIVVAIKHIPSLADEVELNSAGTNLDFDEFDYVINEFDEQAIEQAALVKEASGGEVTVIGIDLIEEIDGVLHTALAKGADKVAKIVGDIEPGLDSHTHAKLLADAIKAKSPDMVFCGVQAADDIDGQIGPMLAVHLDMPYIGVVADVTASGSTAMVKKEYSGGVMAEFEVTLPAVFGVQAATNPPRYAPVSKIRQMAQGAEIEEIEAEGGDGGANITLKKMAKPESTGHAEMIDGDAEETAAKIIALIKERGLL